MKEQEKNLEICSKFNTVLSEIHSEKLSIGLQIVEAMKGRIFLTPVILDAKGRDVTMIRPEVERKVIIYLNRSKNADLAEYEVQIPGNQHDRSGGTACCSGSNGMMPRE